MEPKFPTIEVQLTGEDGNAFAIIGAVRRALKQARDGSGIRLVTDEQIVEFSADAMSGDYDHLLQVCMEWVNVS